MKTKEQASPTLNGEAWKPEQLAESLQGHTETIRRHLRLGLIKGVRFGRHWRIPADEVARLRAGTTDSQREAAPSPAALPGSEALPRVLTVTEAAVWLRCGERDVRKLIRKGVLPSIADGWRIPLDAVLQILMR